MIDSERAASILHHSMVQSVARAQKRIVLHEAILKRFGHDTVPQETFLITRHALLNGADQMMDYIKQDEDRIKEFVEAIRELETVFAEKEKADISDMVAAIKRRHGLD